MTHPLTETSEFLDAFVVADDGDVDAMTAPGSPSSVVTDEEMFLAAANRTRFLLDSLHGAQVGHVRAVTDNATHAVTVSLGRITLARKFYGPTTSGSTVLTPPVAAAWYYLYLYDGGGFGALEMSSDGPDDGLVLKSTDPTRRYLCALPWYSSSGIKLVDLSSAGGSYRYRHTNATGQEAFLARTVPTGILSLNDQVPPAARIVHLRLRLVDGGSGGTANVSFDPLVGSAQPITVSRPMAANEELQLAYSVPLTGNIARQLNCGNTSSGVAATLIVDGWEE